jgi:hypothetical protein
MNGVNRWDENKKLNSMDDYPAVNSNTSPHKTFWTSDKTATGEIKTFCLVNPLLNNTSIVDTHC